MNSLARWKLSIGEKLGLLGYQQQGLRMDIGHGSRIEPGARQDFVSRIDMVVTPVTVMIQ